MLISVIEKPIKKTKGGQKLTWHQVITRDLNTINIDLNKAIELSKDNSRNQDSGKLFYLEKQEYVDSCETHDI